MSKELEERDLSREEAATQLQEVATALRTGDTMDMEINNRTVHLSPAETVALDITVEERSTLIRGDRETVTLKLDWEPP